MESHDRAAVRDFAIPVPAEQREIELTQDAQLAWAPDG
jgi:hypothetical protein